MIPRCGGKNKLDQFIEIGSIVMQIQDSKLQKNIDFMFVLI